ncbi:hypothetical protein D030_4790B, partial [Vibrio parahaemolyticus AQ3810]
HTLSTSSMSKRQVKQRLDYPAFCVFR